MTELISFPYFVDEHGGKPKPFKITTGLTGYVLRSGRPLLLDRETNAGKKLVGDEVTFEGHPEIRYQETGRPAAIWLGVPLSIGGRPLGVMAVQDYHDDLAYGEEEKQILSFVAAQIAQAIDRKRSEQDLRERSERVLRHRNVLLELAQLDKSDFNAALERICTLSAATLNAARASYWSLRENGTSICCELLYLGTSDQFAPEARGTTLHTSDYPAYFTALAGHQPIAAGDAVNHPATRELAPGYLKPLGIGALLDVPVWLHGRVVGVLCHEHLGPPRDWSVEETDFASSLATMVALSLEAAQRAKSEQALRESEEKHRALFEASSQGVMLHDEHQFLEVNPAAVRILRCESAAEIIGRRPLDMAPPTQPAGESSVSLAHRFIAECMERGSARFEWISRNPRGDCFPLEVILTRIPMGGRHIIQAVINDIAERKRAEEELRQSEARLRESEARFSAAFHASPVYITIDRMSDGRIVEANDAFVQWIGYSRPEIIGRTSVELGVWANLEERDGYWGELERHHRVRNRECQLASRRGALHLMLLSADIIEINKEPHVLTVGLDIRDRKKAEIELLRALGREKELSQLKTDFVSTVSHEFRTPLGIIMSSAEILEDYLEELDVDERQHHLRSIARNTKRMSELMEEVLVLGRLDAGRMDFKPATLDFRGFCSRLVEEVLSATNRTCPIELAIDDIAPAHADERLLRHILLNLLTNGVKYSESGRAVEFVVRREAHDAVCLIRDLGIGIPEADLPWLFNAFHRGRNVGQRPGTGLGLVIVKRCVELHGGTIHVESKTGEGTTMTVRVSIFPVQDISGVS
jgi:PAS domain S-box-containing protein